MNGTETQGASGLLGAVKENAAVNTLVERIQESRSMIVDVGLYGGIGLLTGFFVKKYSTLVVFLVLMIISLYVFSHLHFITINWATVYETMGIQSTALLNSENIFFLVSEWIKSNMVAAISCVVGFLLGLKMG